MACTPSTQCSAPTSCARSAISATGGRGADQVGCRGGGDQPGALADRGGDGIRRQLTGRRVEVDPAHGGAHRLGRLHPRPDVGVVVEPGHDHLVARPPALRQGPREVVGERGGAAAEHDAARVGPEQVGQGGAAVGDHLLGTALRRGDGAAVGDRAGQRVGDGPADDVRGLAAAGAVEVRGPLGERGEVGTDRGDVERHTGILSHPGGPATVTRRCAAGGPPRSRRCSAGRRSRARGTPRGCGPRRRCSCCAARRRSRRARPRRSGGPGRRTSGPS